MLSLTTKSGFCLFHTGQLTPMVKTHCVQLCQQLVLKKSSVLKGVLSLAALWARKEDHLYYTLCSQVHEEDRVELKCCCNPMLAVVEIGACFALCKSLRMINWGKARDEVCLWSRSRCWQFFLSVFLILSLHLLPLSLPNEELSLNPCEWIICPFATCTNDMSSSDLDLWQLRASFA